MDDSKFQQLPDDSPPSVSDDTDSSASYRRFALVAFAAILGYGTVADAEAEALRVFPSGTDLSLNVSISIPLPVAPIQGTNTQGQGNGTCTQGNACGEGNCSAEGSCGVIADIRQHSTG